MRERVLAPVRIVDLASEVGIVALDSEIVQCARAPLPERVVDLPGEIGIVATHSDLPERVVLPVRVVDLASEFDVIELDSDEGQGVAADVRILDLASEFDIIAYNGELGSSVVVHVLPTFRVGVFRTGASTERLVDALVLKTVAHVVGQLLLYHTILTITIPPL